ncbi:chloride channel protein, partial [Erwinia tasmaniensis]|uniref:chloride channel protein n=1 Tax=Erwinia tasmaniensis TaxID=338565 RepID=UPI003A4DE7CF
MNSASPSTDTLSSVPARRGDFLRLLLKRDKTSVAVLVLAGVVGMLAGLLGVGFEKAVLWVTTRRLSLLAALDAHWLLFPLAFILSALLAVAGYWLVQRFAPEASGSGIPEIEGALEELRPVRWWRVIPVKFIGGMGTLGAGMVLGLSLIHI